MYTENKSAVTISNKKTDFVTRGRGVNLDCCLSPGLFNIYIHELATMLE